MKIFYVWSAARYAVHDVATGYATAFERAGHDVHHFRLYTRLEWYASASAAVGEPDTRETVGRFVKVCSDLMVAEFLRHGQDADMIFIVSGIALHPDVLWMLKQMKRTIPVAILLTESPYVDDAQHYLAQFCDVVFTTERVSAEKYGWHYLRHAYEPAVHHTGAADADLACDVVMIATGFQDRLRVMEAIDWGNIDFRLMGNWPEIDDSGAGHPLYRYYNPTIVPNERAVDWYRAATISLNLHRKGAHAESANPRTYELAACGAFQLASWRPEIEEIFGDSVAMFQTPQDLQRLMYYWLNPGTEQERKDKAERSRQLVQGETFDARASEVLSCVVSKPQAALAAV